ncbi:MAG: dehydrogenase, partial [Verrucomicrobiota bacterium]
LGRARLDAVQLRQLTEVLQAEGPLEFLRLLPAYERGGDEALGARLLAALRDAKARAALRPELVRQAVKNFPEGTRREAEALVAMLNANVAAQGERLERLLGELKGVHGDVRRGQAIFLGQKAACFTCHKIGYQGGLFGPDLTSIGQARTERDLLESIVYPSASFVRSYEPMVVVTRSGEEMSGILRSENDRELVLVSGPGAEQRIPRLEVADQRPGTVSLMPAGLDEQLGRQELADLLAFLKNTKWGPN